MIKICQKNEDGSKSITLGLTATNISRLRASEPIMFRASEVELSGGMIVLMYARDEKTEIVQKISPPMLKILFLLDDDTLDRIQEDGPMGTAACRQIDNVEFIFVWIESEQDAMQRYQSAMGPKTKVVFKGWHPTDLPTSLN